MNLQSDIRITFTFNSRGLTFSLVIEMRQKMNITEQFSRSLFALSLIFNIIFSVSASSGNIAIRALDGVHTENLTHITESFLSRNRTVEFKSKEQWDSMNVDDFKEYDVLVILGFGCPTENPFSNSYAWRSASNDGNAIISSIADLNQLNPPEVREIVDSAVEFTLTGNGTGVYISIGHYSPTCLEEKVSDWITEAFMAEFIIRSISSSRYWKNDLVAWNPAFNSVTSDMVKTAPSNTENLPIFIQYPDIWYPLVVAADVYYPWASYTSEGGIFGAPTILIKGDRILMPGETLTPSNLPAFTPTLAPTVHGFHCQDKNEVSSKSRKRKKKSKSYKRSKSKKRIQKCD